MDKQNKEVKKADAGKFKYLCEGCTNEALESTNKMIGVKITCPHCQKEQITKEENFVEQ
jgi:DNA-directed RNA polymerase subunit RPC12/RpoP